LMLEVVEAAKAEVCSVPASGKAFWWVVKAAVDAMAALAA